MKFWPYSYYDEDGSSGYISIAYETDILNNNCNNSGDINYDGVVNILDVILLINNILSPLPYEIDGGDLNDDGTINILDVVQLVNIILN